ncbi:MAG: D-alanine--D-alanine ligase [Deltaproteobacteria bacterium]|nr:D-alanine--D-alanine ligase [Deltaproteobacteria bacterium]
MSDVESRKPLVIVFIGGESGEHDISLKSGAAVIRNLPSAGFQAMPVLIGQDGSFGFPPPEDPTRFTHSVGIGEAVYKMASMNPACAFIAMHGTFGEDGRVQALCDLMHIPHVGSDVTGSAVSMDKWLTKTIFRDAGIPTPDAVLEGALDTAEDTDGLVERVEDRIGLPCVVKTTRLGSSLGVGIAGNPDELERLVQDARGFGGVMLEAFHPGREMTVSVLEDPDTGEPEALPVIEIIPSDESKFFDQKSKYGLGVTQADEICPADIPDSLAARVGELAVMAHRALMLSGFSRTDFMVDDEGVWALETNSIPGLTEVSLFPKAAEAAGIGFSELVGRLVRRAMSGPKSR